MKHALLIIALATCYTSSHAQYVYNITADTVKITSTCDSGELIIRNHTQGIKGFLLNIGGGRTQFQKVLQQLNSNTYLIGGDTLMTGTGTGGIQQVADIPSLEADTSKTNTVLVMDSLRGGLFYYQSTAALVDSGIVFRATGRGTGYWVRQYDKSNAANIEWYGAIPNNTSLADQNFHAIQFCLNANTDVLIPIGTFYYDSTLYINNGQHLAGSRAQANGVPTGGASLTIVDTLPGLMLAYPSGQNVNFTVLEDFTLQNNAAGGILNSGIVITRGFVNINRVNVNGFGQHGIYWTSKYNGNNTIADYGEINLVNAGGNGGDGFYIGGGADNNLLTFNSCSAANNLYAGFYTGGNHHVLMNCSTTNNSQYGFYDVGSSNQFMNPSPQSGGTNGLYLAGNFGSVISSAGEENIFPTGPSINSYDISIGTYKGHMMQMADPVYIFDSTYWVIGNVGEGITGGLQFYQQTSGQSPNNAIFALNQDGAAASNFFTGYGGVFHFGPDGGNAPTIGCFGSATALKVADGNFGLDAKSMGGSGSNMRGLLEGYNALGHQFFTTILDANSSPSQGSQVGLELATSFDTVNNIYRPNNYGTYEYIDPTTGQITFVSCSGIESPVGGGNFNFLSQDQSTNLYINTYNKSTYAKVLKIGPYLTASPTDSLLAWEPSDSAVRKTSISSLFSKSTNNVVTVAGNYSPSNAYPRNTIIFNAASGTITLPDPTLAANQNIYYFVRVNASGQTATVATAAGQIETALGTLSSTATISAIPNQGWISDGANWRLSN